MRRASFLEHTAVQAEGEAEQPLAAAIMYDLAGENELDLEALRMRLRGMSDRELVRFGKAARYMCSPEANLGKEPRQAFVIQLREAEKEWRLHQQR